MAWQDTSYENAQCSSQGRAGQKKVLQVLSCVGRAQLHAARRGQHPGYECVCSMNKVHVVGAQDYLGTCGPAPQSSSQPAQQRARQRHPHTQSLSDRHSGIQAGRQAGIARWQRGPLCWHAQLQERCACCADPCHAWQTFLLACVRASFRAAPACACTHAPRPRGPRTRPRPR